MRRGVVLAIVARGGQTPGTMAMTFETVFRTCGAECEYAQEIRSTFGEWFWCSNPAASVRVVRARHECALPRSSARTVSPPPVPPPGATDEARRVA